MYAKAKRRDRLQGQQIDLAFPVRGRPSHIRVLERCGQLRLALSDNARKEFTRVSRINQGVKNSAPLSESFDAALEYLFPERELTDPEKIAELNQFDSTAITPENPITDKDVPF